jgi:hypothetical protein
MKRRAYFKNYLQEKGATQEIFLHHPLSGRPWKARLTFGRQKIKTFYTKNVWLEISQAIWSFVDLIASNSYVYFVFKFCSKLKYVYLYYRVKLFN